MYERPQIFPLSISHTIAKLFGHESISFITSCFFSSRLGYLVRIRGRDPIRFISDFLQSQPNHRHGWGCLFNFAGQMLISLISSVLVFFPKK
ncbi:hypothetical protein CEXT_487411 [Caerostris extrusa]|uniref:Uncharacterized protein n=1 Tax=Caerostris extrusa TaxID=172846 RepID=A0AAV4T5L2_CAEEX|nr:hypothetical protein CEXT_487411 [Caerostris extrusa]